MSKHKRVTVKVKVQKKNLTVFREENHIIYGKVRIRFNLTYQQKQRNINNNGATSFTFLLFCF